MKDKVIALRLNSDTLIREEKNRRERHRVIMDILDENTVSIFHVQGPYRLEVGIAANKLFFFIEGADADVHRISVPMMALRKIMKDYFIVCDTYYEAVCLADSSKVEAIDMGRRSLHDEGADILRNLLIQHVRMDFSTARKFFSLVCLLGCK